MENPSNRSRRLRGFGCECVCPICTRQFKDQLSDPKHRPRLRGLIAQPCPICLARLIEVGSEVSACLDAIYDDRWTLIRLDHD